eukprot:Seg1427.3 transcript_id=Seg1427.3/GoldUCD/mRNA.D3Y31 product="putative serine racemase" protein_id=Seg1427.3/GoldUCD/D3Y31
MDTEAIAVETLHIEDEKIEINKEAEITKPTWATCGWNLIKRSGDYTSLPEDLQNVITIDELRKAYKLISDNGYIRRTPIIDGTTIFGSGEKNAMRLVKSFGMKLENMQFSGSFKMRGASYQFSQFADIRKQNLVTISAGNYGTSFAYLAKELGIAQNAKVYMPKTVPARRKKRIEAYGVSVNCQFPQDQLMFGVDHDKKARNSAFLHPFDDCNVLIGHGSAGLELLEQEPDVDIVLVCCGGGGFVAGVTTAIRLSGNTTTKVYAVEHEISCTMFDSLYDDKVAKMTEDPGKTVCHGICAPYTGKIPFQVFRAFGDGVINITESEIFRTVKLLYGMGLVVEPSGAAAVAAVLSNKVPDIEGKKVVAFITGGNVSPSELGNIVGEV